MASQLYLFPAREATEAEALEAQEFVGLGGAGNQVINWAVYLHN